MVDCPAIDGIIDEAEDVAGEVEDKRGHFTVRRLERAYGREAVRKAYERVAQDS